MKKSISRLIKLIREKGSLLYAVLFAIISVLFFLISYFGVNHSSLCALENKCHQISEDTGSNTHIRYYLKDESEAKRKSVISQVNSFNDYRLKELGRNVSFVSNTLFNVTYNEISVEANNITYGDIFNDRFTTSYLTLQSGKFNELEFIDEYSIYVTASIIEGIPDLNYSTAVGKKVKLSFDNGHEYVIRGVISTHNMIDTGIHFRHLFGENFILMNSKNVYKYGFTDLMFSSSDYHFVDDLKDFEKKIDKSYLSYDQVKMRLSSITDNQVIMSEIFNFGSVFNAKNITLTVFSLLGLSIVLLADCFLLLVYDFNNDFLLEKIILFIMTSFWAFMPLFGGLFFAKKAVFVTRLVIGFLTAFAAINLLIYLARFAGIFIAKKEEKKGE